MLEYFQLLPRLAMSVSPFSQMPIVLETLIFVTTTASIVLSSSAQSVSSTNV